MEKIDFQKAGMENPSEQEISIQVMTLLKETDRLDWEDWVIDQGLVPYENGLEYPGLEQW